MTDRSCVLQCGIGLGLSIGRITEGGSNGSVLGGTGDMSPPKTAWNILVAIGSIAFAFSFVSCRHFANDGEFQNLVEPGN